MAENVLIQSGDRELHGLRGRPGERAIGHLEKTLVLMLHDFPGDKDGLSDVFVTLEDLLLDRGFHTLRFDFSGCGDSGGREEDFTLSSAAEDIESVFAWAKAEGFEHYILAGEGLGAALCLLNTNLSVSGNIFLWPALDLPGYADTLYGSDAIPMKTEQGADCFDVDGHRIAKELLDQLRRADMVAALKDAYAPVLIMHGAEDEVLPSSQLELARKHIRAQRVEITIFHDGNHGLTTPKHRKMMFYHIFQFLEKYA